MSKSEEQSINPNTVHLLRALVKMSCALEDIDELQESKLYRQNIKVSIKRFLKCIEESVDPVMVDLMQKDDVAYPILMKAVNSLFEDEHDFLFKLKAKIESALFDAILISEEVKKESHIVKAIIPRLQELDKSLSTVGEAIKPDFLQDFSNKCNKYIFV